MARLTPRKITLSQAVLLCLFEHKDGTSLDVLLRKIQRLRWGGRPVSRKVLERELRAIRNCGEEITWAVDEHGVFSRGGLSAELSMFLPGIRSRMTGEPLQPEAPLPDFFPEIRDGNVVRPAISS